VCGLWCGSRGAGYRAYGVWGVIDCCESELNVSSASGCLFRACILSGRVVLRSVTKPPLGGENGVLEGPPQAPPDAKAPQAKILSVFTS